MFEEFYEMYEPEEQEVVALINRCIGGGYNWKGNFWEMTVVTLEFQHTHSARRLFWESVSLAKRFRLPVSLSL